MLTGTGAVSNDPTLAGTVQEVDDDEPTKEGTDNGREEIKKNGMEKKRIWLLAKKAQRFMTSWWSKTCSRREQSDGESKGRGPR